MYLAISTIVLSEVVGHPDSGRTGVRIAADRGKEARFLIENSAKDSLGYWDREDGRGVAAIVARIGTR